MTKRLKTCECGEPTYSDRCALCDADEDLFQPPQFQTPEDRRIAELQRQLAEVTEERDQLRAMLNLADALRNREKQMRHGDNYKFGASAFRKTYFGEDK
jgi:rRNA maturation protein Nop10